jgi:phosphopantothenoylcysteine decarboxylase/phosphopantothenate--cysteine ligase
MLEAVEAAISNCDIFISAAAVSDFTPKAAKKKIETKKGGPTLKLTPTPKILERIKDSKAVKVGFKALHGTSEKELCDAALKSLKKYRLDLVVANDVKRGAFGSDDNDVYIVNGKRKPIHIKDKKEEIARRILDAIEKGE